MMTVAHFLVALLATTVTSWPVQESSPLSPLPPAIEEYDLFDNITSASNPVTEGPKLTNYSLASATNHAAGPATVFSTDPELNSRIALAIQKRDTEGLGLLQVPAEEIEPRQSKGELTPAKCRYYCFHSSGQLYCCEFAPIKSLKRGQCPKVRPYCPQSFGRSATAAHAMGKRATGDRCVEDDYCPGPDKCCFDRCHMTSVCKTPINVFQMQ